MTTVIHRISSIDFLRVPFCILWLITGVWVELIELEFSFLELCTDSHNLIFEVSDRDDENEGKKSSQGEEHVSLHAESLFLDLNLDGNVFRALFKVSLRTALLQLHQYILIVND